MGSRLRTGVSRRRPGAWGRSVGIVLLALLVAPLTADGATTEVRRRTDVVYAQSQDGPLHLDLYRLRDKRRAPVVLLIHGGSWRSGSKADWEDIAPRFARAGFLVIVPDYSLSAPGGNAVFPQHLEDLERALLWARERAEDFGGRPRRIGMVGASAGGHLTLLQASSGALRPDAIALYSAPADLVGLFDRGIGRDAIEGFLGCSPDVCPDTFEAASGIARADGEMPPVMLAYSKQEILPLSHSRALARRLRDLKIKTVIHELPGHLHGLAVGKTMIEETIMFMERSL